MSNSNEIKIVYPNNHIVYFKVDEEEVLRKSSSKDIMTENDRIIISSQYVLNQFKTQLSNSTNKVSVCNLEISMYDVKSIQNLDFFKSIGDLRAKGSTNLQEFDFAGMNEISIENISLWEIPWKNFQNLRNFSGFVHSLELVGCNCENLIGLENITVNGFINIYDCKRLNSLVGFPFTTNSVIIDCKFRYLPLLNSNKWKPWLEINRDFSHSYN